MWMTYSIIMPNNLTSGRLEFLVGTPQLRKGWEPLIKIKQRTANSSEVALLPARHCSSPEGSAHISGPGTRRLADKQKRTQVNTHRVEFVQDNNFPKMTTH